MAKRDNRGFSLIEIIIAVAILTLLIVPIMTQFTNTLSTNRKAKEQQYANENASFVLETFQKEEVDVTKIMSGGAIITSSGGITANPTSKAAITCQLYLTDGTPVTTTSGSIEYNAYTYKLDDKKLGAKKTTYNRTVVLDDLTNKIRAQYETTLSGKTGYRVAYNLTEADLANFSSASIGGKSFELTDEGSIVCYNDEGFVVGVACNTTANGDYTSNPNEQQIASIQNLDSNKVALINGYASNFDQAAESTFYALALDRLKVEDEDSWRQAVLRNDGGILATGEYASSIYKYTVLTVDDVKKADGTTHDYYLVKAQVFFNNSYRLTKTAAEQPEPYHDSTSYVVFAQKFYTTDTQGNPRCPDVYFEYQPYVEEMSMTNGLYDSLWYGADDYLIIDNKVEGANIYLYKPTTDMMQATAQYNEDVKNGKITTTEATTSVEPEDPATGGAIGSPPLPPAEPELTTEDNSNKEGYSYYVTSSGINKNKEVKLHVYSFGQLVGPLETNKEANIYTNLKLSMFDVDCGDTADTAKDAAEKNIMDKALAQASATTPAAIASYSDFSFKGAERDEDGNALIEAGNYKYIDLVKSIYDESRTENRLFTITVRLEPVDESGNPIVSSNKVVLTGAKGEK